LFNSVGCKNNNQLKILELMKKLVLVVVCAFASFAFSDASSLEGNEYGVCDSLGGERAGIIAIDCDGDGTSDIIEGVVTCADYWDSAASVLAHTCQ